MKFFEKIESGINKNDYFVNSLNIFPSLVWTQNGYLFDHVDEDKAYIYERNDVVTDINTEDIIYIYFRLKNTANEYNRIYKRLQDVIPKIGGLIRQ